MSCAVRSCTSRLLLNEILPGTREAFRGTKTGTFRVHVQVNDGRTPQHDFNICPASGGWQNGRGEKNRIKKRICERDTPMNNGGEPAGDVFSLS